MSDRYAVVLVDYITGCARLSIRPSVCQHHSGF